MLQIFEFRTTNYSLMIHTVASKVILEELSSGSRMEAIETYLVNMILMQGN